MATYAAYRHVEIDKVGYGKKRVLKPPGGGSSDIFGGGSKFSSPRKANKPHQQSQLGACFFNGDQQQQPAQPQAQAQSPSSNGSSAPETPRSKPDGNPVTGTGYEASAGQQNGSISGSASSAGSEKSSTDSSPVVMRMKNRVPPGGFSSGLW